MRNTIERKVAVESDINEESKCVKSEITVMMRLFQRRCHHDSRRGRGNINAMRY